MIHAARVAAAAAILDRVSAGEPAERALLHWARGSRYAGSGDRRAVRDLVFDVLRRRRSLAARGGGATGRLLMAAYCAEAGTDPDTVFTGGQYAPEPLSAAERAGLAPDAAMTPAERLDVPDWVYPVLVADLGAAAEPAMAALRHRAPVFLRVNPGRAPDPAPHPATDPRSAAIAALRADGIEARPHGLSPLALEVAGPARALRNGTAFRAGLVELQDVSSQAVVDVLARDLPGARALDYCAGGGGKALAMAALGADVSVHDAHAGRMVDLPQRAARAGVRLAVQPPGAVRGQWDVVLVDAPCSGSGAWRRQVEAKWRLTPEALAAYGVQQGAILAAAARHVAPGGVLAYATCSLFAAENEARVAAFLADGSDWSLRVMRRFLPGDDSGGASGETRNRASGGGDGFFVALLDKRAACVPAPPSG